MARHWQAQILLEEWAEVVPSAKELLDTSWELPGVLEAGQDPERADAEPEVGHSCACLWIHLSQSVLDLHWNAVEVIFCEET